MKTNSLAVPELRPVSKTLRARFLSRLKKCKVPGTWKIVTERNGRGDYGQDQHFYFKGLLAFVISIDGARQDVRLAVTPFCPVSV